MRRILCLLALLLVAALLAGCGGSDKTYTCGELTMTVPGYMEDASGQSDFAAYTFTLDSTEIAIFGLQETYADYPVLTAYTLADYTDLVISSNGVNAAAEYRSGQDYLYFTYSYDTDQGEYRYLVATFRTDEGFWVIQFSAQASNYDESAFFGYLDSVSFS